MLTPLFVALLGCPSTDPVPAGPVRDTSPSTATAATGQASTASSGSTGLTGSTGLPTTAQTGDTAPPEPITSVPTDAPPWTFSFGAPVSLSEAGGLRDSHAVGAGHGVGWLVGWTAEIPGGGTKSTALRLLGPDGNQWELPSQVRTDGPAIVSVGSEAAVAFGDIEGHRMGTLQVSATGQLGDVSWVDGSAAPNLPFAVDAAATSDGSMWLLWSDVLWTVAMEEEDFAAAPDGAFRLAYVNPNGAFSGPVDVRHTTAPGGKHPPDIEVLPNDDVVYVVTERAAHDQPAQLALYRLRDGHRVPLSTPGVDGSRSNMAVDALGRLAVVWREGAVTELKTYLSLFDSDLNQLVGPMELEPGWTSDRPTVVAHPEGWLLAWEKPLPMDSDWTGHRELRVRLLAADGLSWRTRTTLFPSTDRRRRPAFAHGPGGTLLLFEQGPNDDTFVRYLTIDVEAP